MRKLLSIALISLLALLCANTVWAQTPGQGGIEPIPVDQAFQFSATARDYQTVLVSWKIADNYFLYRDRFHFKAIKPKNAAIGDPLLPEGVNKSNPAIGNYEVYEHAVTIPIPVINSNGKNIVLQVTYQGCSAQGFCYPPTTKVVSINLAGNYMIPVSGIDIDVAPSTTTISGQPTSTQGKIADLFSTGNLLTLLLGFFGFGLLVSLTPCVLPMIPILSGIILGQKHITHWRSFILSFSYVIGMAVTYALAGVLFGALGGTVQAWMQQPWIILLFSGVFVAMALSLFGLYNIQLPRAFQSSYAHAGEHQKHGSVSGTFLMGCLSTLILSPCVTPPLVAALTYIGQSGNATVGGIALFTMGIGMGVPLLIIGASSAKFLPKSGPWMVTVKCVMGIMMLAVAVWMLSRILPGTATMFLWALLAIGTAIYLGAFTSSKTTHGFIAKLIGILLFVYGVLLGVGAVIGNTNPLQPFSFAHQRAATSDELNFQRVKTIDDVNQAIERAKQKQQIVMLDFYADWCISCKEMDHFTFANPNVKAALKNVMLLRADVTANDFSDKMLEQHFGVVAPPTMIFFGTDGNEIKNSRIVGQMSASRFLKHLKQYKVVSLTP